ncbi:MAG: MopE-related protein [Chitinophagales bacterium]
MKIQISFNTVIGIGLFTSVLCACFSTPAKAQPIIEWQKSLGGSDYDGAFSVQQTADEGFIVAGFSYSDDGDVSENNGYMDYWLVKQDASGTLEWENSLGGNSFDAAYSVRQTSDDGFIVAGYSSSAGGDVSGNHGAYDYWVIKLDAAGVIIWQKSLGGSLEDLAHCVEQTADNGFIIAGSSGSGDGDVSGNHGAEDYWIVKLDESGNLQWQKSLGGSMIDFASYIEQTDDMGYIVAGYTYSSDGDVSINHGANDYWIVKLDSAGGLQWQKSLGGSASDQATCIRQTTDGGFVVAGISESSDGDVSGNHGLEDFWVVKLDETGSMEWQKSMGGSSYDEAYSIDQTSEGGFIVAGQTQSGDGDVSFNHGSGDDWIVKLDPYGNLSSEVTYGGSGNDAAHSIQQTSSGGFIVGGYTFSSDGDVSGNHGYQDYWILNLSCISTTLYYADADNDGYGNADSAIASCLPVNGYVGDSTDCDDTNINIHPDATEIQYNGMDDNCNGIIDEFPTAIFSVINPSALNLIPNPAATSIIAQLNCNQGFPYSGSSCEIIITDVTGRNLIELTSSCINGVMREEILFSKNILPGIYFVKVNLGNMQWLQKLMVK